MRLRKDEEVLLETGPSGALLGYWVVSRCLPGGVAAGGAAAVAALVLSDGAAASAVLSGGVAFIVTFAAGSFYAACLRRTYRYYVTDRRCAFSGGILLRIRHSVPHHKITDVEQRQTILERIFGIWRLGVYTPGTSSGGDYGLAQPEVAFPGLKDPDEAGSAIEEMLDRPVSPGE